MSELLDSLLDRERRGDCAWHDGLGAWDSLPVQRAIHRAAMEADEIAAEQQARREILTEKVQESIKAGDAWAACYFAGKRSAWNTKESCWDKVQENLGDILADSLDTNRSLSFHDVAQYLLDQSKQGDGKARELLNRMVDVWVGAQ